MRHGTPIAQIGDMTCAILAPEEPSIVIRIVLQTCFGILPFEVLDSGHVVAYHNDVHVEENRYTSDYNCSHNNRNNR